MKNRKSSAMVYTLLGLTWALLTFITVNHELKTLVLLGIAVPVLLLVARLVRVQRESLDISLHWELGKTDRWTSANRKIIVLAVSILISIFAATLLLRIFGKPNWIGPVAVVLFNLHFYLLPQGFSIREDILLASAADFAVVITPFWLPERTAVWSSVALSACALACWLAADLRYQHILVLQEEERAEIDHEAFS